MIEFKNLDKSPPYRIFKKFYLQAQKSNQKSIDAIAISSYNSDLNEVDSRYVNLKYVDHNDWVFFSNYNSPKAHQFKMHDQISCTFFWNNINVQIRLKARIKKLELEKSDKYFENRDAKKNALSISSKQSNPAVSYQEIVNDYNLVQKCNINLNKRPAYWGGYAFKPYYFEFWEGHDARINKRISYAYVKDLWLRELLQP